MAIRTYLHSLKPKNRRQLVRWLELASDDPELRPDQRRRAEQHLFKVKAILRAEPHQA